MMMERCFEQTDYCVGKSLFQCRYCTVGGLTGFAFMLILINMKTPSVLCLQSGSKCMPVIFLLILKTLCCGLYSSYESNICLADTSLNVLLPLVKNLENFFSNNVSLFVQIP